MLNRYNFYSIFNYDSTTGLLHPLYNTVINGAYYPASIAISKGPSFGGLDLYNLMGKDVAASWSDTSRILTIAGFY